MREYVPELRCFKYPIIISQMSTQQRAVALLQKPSLSPTQRKQLLTLLIQNGTDLPDAKFENAYLLYLRNPESDQKYIQQEELIYNGLQLRLEKKVLIRFVMNLKRKIGDNTYVRRLAKFIHFVMGGEESVSGMEELLQDDLADNETYKKTIASCKKLGRIDEYIEKLNKYLSIEPMDEQAWLELAQIYCERGHHMKSAFCYEQLIILNPSNDIYYLKLSELYLTLNSKNTTDKAIKYLSYLITKRPNNLRALWILYRTVHSNQQYRQLKEVCSEAINKLYSKNNQKVKIHLAL